MQRRLFLLSIMLAAVVGGFISVIIAQYFVQPLPYTPPYQSIEDRQNIKLTRSVTDSNFTIPNGLNFVSAAENVIEGVVHVRTYFGSGNYSINALERYFNHPSRSSGSGVIISDDGFVATNYHVVEDANQVEVVLNDNRRFDARVIGTDPTTDLALLKIDAYNLSFVPYGNSDRVKTGEWVLAIGNPFDLNSTVTAGIVSAKARNIGILRDKNNLQIESFLQTDAAINPGNSGGALINLEGQLIGINTAIATPTGNYAGYSFAIPVALVKKVMDDLLEFGEVQRGLLGIRIGDVNAQLAEAQGLDVYQGVYVSYVNENSAAEAAGMRSGDVITAIDGKKVDNVSELQELVARNRPGDDVMVTFIRAGKENEVKATLRNYQGSTELKAKPVKSELNGAVFEDLSNREIKQLDLQGGVKIKNVHSGPWQQAGVKEGFIVLSVDRLKVKDLKELNQVLENRHGSILVEGVYPDGEKGVYGLDWDQ